MGHRCIGAPIFDATGQIAVAVSISGTTAQVDERNAPRLADEVKKTAAAISLALAQHRPVDADTAGPGQPDLSTVRRD